MAEPEPISMEPELTGVREAHRFDEAKLFDYLTKHLDGFTGDVAVQQFEGGQSNPTFMLSANDRRWVLRKKPPGDLLPSAHQVEREYRVMHALQDTDVPVPRTDLLCEDTSVMGTPFFVMGMVEGRVIGTVLEADITPEHRNELYKNTVRVLAKLHQVDYKAVGLGEGFGRPGNYFDRQIGRWSKQYRASETDNIPEMNQLIDWLPNNVPQDDVNCIVHGDYSIRNTIVHQTEPRTAAILDWELSTIGHPFGDLAYFCNFYHFPREDDVDLKQLGVPDEQEIVKIYCEETGRSEAADDWPFYIAYSLFRLASIVQGVYKRGLDGNASSERALEQRDNIHEFAKAGWRAIAESR